MATAQFGAVLDYIHSLPADSKKIEQTDGALLRTFVNDYDQGAFEALLRRHGAMVLRVCQRALGQVHDAEDAFQATFLALAQRATSIRKHESLASWLHGVAYRMATNMNRASGRRRKHEAQAKQGQPKDPALCAAWQEIQGLLDQEVAALPETLRQAFVYCCLENKSCAEAARLLRVEQGTVEMRLTRARRQLRDRLTRRGVSLTAVLAATAICVNGVSAAIRPAAVRSLAQAAVGLAAGRGPGCGLVSSRAIDLVKGANQTMFVIKSKVTLVVILGVLGVAGLGSGLSPAARRSAQEATAPPAVRPPEEATRNATRKERHDPGIATAHADSTDAVTVSGRVLGPDGKPVANAAIYLGHYGPKGEVAVTEQAQSDADGRFEFRFRKSEVSKAQPTDEADPHLTPVGQVLAATEGLGCDWARIDPAAGSAELTLRLVKDVPISGRILDQDGKPVPGAKLNIRSINGYAGEDLKEALAKFRTSNAFPLGVKRWGGPLPGQARVVTTGPDGRFGMTGLGGERNVNLHIEGPGIASTNFQVITRLGDTVAGPDKLKGSAVRPLPPGQMGDEELIDVSPNKVYGASFRYLAAPARPIRGVVTDKVTGTPLAGVMISVAPNSWEVVATAHTDGKGRYELLGCAKSPTYSITAQSSDTGPYFTVSLSKTDAPGIGPMTVDIQMLQGIPIRGKVLDERTGKAIAGARVSYWCVHPNAAGENAFRAYSDVRSNAITGLDGSFVVVAVPGPGIVGAWAPDSTWDGRSPVSKAYRPGKVTAKEWDDFVAKYKVQLGLIPPHKKWDDAEKCEVMEFVAGEFSGSSVGALILGHFNSVALIHPDEKDKELTKDLALRPKEVKEKSQDDKEKPQDEPRKLKKPYGGK